MRIAHLRGGLTAESFGELRQDVPQAEKREARALRYLVFGDTVAALARAEGVERETVRGSIVGFIRSQALHGISIVRKGESRFGVAYGPPVSSGV